MRPLENVQQLGNCIGKGQFASVYRALNLQTGQVVAIKRAGLSGLNRKDVDDLMVGEQNVSRWMVLNAFPLEVDLLKSLSHPGIVKYEGCLCTSEYLYIILEYVFSLQRGRPPGKFLFARPRSKGARLSRMIKRLATQHPQSFRQLPGTAGGFLHGEDTRGTRLPPQQEGRALRSQGGEHPYHQERQRKIVGFRRFSQLAARRFRERVGGRHALLE
ncbi:MAG: hypothetical protein BJ554DRAFT_2940 [Olpidium bornovanus]|uniref:non-specific serine/threonine protein kinase n=1 Tax=Olpidium bornovanus TaxID=278681 RepID=A0A8H7ZQ91_9FUNG|nr:MAG: hypothetical protein BJ554DRAFT_2940 [Olpidium bornovanus]